MLPSEKAGISASWSPNWTVSTVSRSSVILASQADRVRAVEKQDNFATVDVRHRRRQSPLLEPQKEHFSTCVRGLAHGPTLN
jgi:hypothetical protein